MLLFTEVATHAWYSMLSIKKIHWFFLENASPHIQIICSIWQVIFLGCWLAVTGVFPVHPSSTQPPYFGKRHGIGTKDLVVSAIGHKCLPVLQTFNSCSDGWHSWLVFRVHVHKFISQISNFHCSFMPLMSSGCLVRLVMSEMQYSTSSWWI